MEYNIHKYVLISVQSHEKQDSCIFVINVYVGVGSSKALDGHVLRFEVFFLL